VGKTRLALEVAHKLGGAFSDGAYWVELAGVGRSEDVASTILRALSVTPLPGEPAEDKLRWYLAAKRLLLVIDNFEHVLGAADLVGELCGTCPGLGVLVTSREALDLAGEHRFVVEPLAVPVVSENVSVGEIESADASALFAAAARRRDRRFAVTPDRAPPIARICARLDGLPLALELAAARTGLLDVDELAATLEATVGELGSGPRDAPDRQRTLTATIDWSYQLLDVSQRRAFSRFAVFAGGATVTAAESITRAESGTLQSLIAKSLLEHRRGAGGCARIVMLETVRHDALARLAESPDESAVRQAHCEYYSELVDDAVPRLSTYDEREAFAAIEGEIDNIREALEWALSEAPSRALRLAGRLGDYWAITGDREGLPWLEAALNAAGDRPPAEDRARAMIGRAWQLWMKSGAFEGASEALELSEQANDHAGICEAYCCLAKTALREREKAHELATEACRHARLAGDDALLGRALMTLATTLPMDDERAALDQAAELLRQTGNYRAIAEGYSNAAFHFVRESRAAEAEAMLDVALAAAEQTRAPIPASLIFVNMGWAKLLLGELDAARASFARQLQLCLNRGYQPGANEGLAGLAAIATARNVEPESAPRLLGAARAIGWPIAESRELDERLEHDYFAPARARFGLAAWRIEEQVGSALSYEKAIAYALS
jgi:predicted ATPase